jgi:histidinol phosphatase-like PHP family hydrolase
VLGYEAIAITDHADSSNIDFLIPRIAKAAQDLNRYSKTRLLVGVELTHVPPELIAPLAANCRKLGAEVIVVHGETVVEPVAPGTNMAALLSDDVDVLAHPGLMTAEEMKLAAEKGVLVELSGRKGHSLTNGHVAKLALEHGAKLAVNADAHGPSDFLTAKMAELVARGAGLTAAQYQDIRTGMSQFVSGIK